MGFDFDARVVRRAERAAAAVEPYFKRIDETAEKNQQKVLLAFQKERVSSAHFSGTSGYGYDDRGREVLDAVFASSFGAEDAIVRHSFASGTHTITVALFGLLRPGDTLLSATGTPYDTLHSVIGPGEGSLHEFKISYKECALISGRVDLEKVRKSLTNDVKAVLLQRSRGYDSSRVSFSAEELGGISREIKKVRPDVITAVDNCYGEFVDEYEPTHYGADLIMGSLIKNPGGGIAKCGGYIAGRRDLVEKISHRATVPGIGREIGATLGLNEGMFMGLFMAPHAVAQALKTAVFCAELYRELGFEVNPGPGEKRSDIIQSVVLGSKERLLAFCEGVQRGAPVDSHVSPVPWAMPGYAHDVIMAAGNFVQGATSEFSADAPIRPPYAAYLQGALNFESGKIGVMSSMQSLLSKGLIDP